MAKIKILTEADLRDQIRLDLDAVSCVENAFDALATKNVVMPPILSMNIPEKNGEVDVKTAYVPGLESFAIKISPGFFDNVKLGLPSLNGIMVLFSANTGLVEAVLLDNGYLTVVRTAAAGAMAAKHLARDNSTKAAILGGGEQGRLQLEALTLVRPIESARIWARRPEQAAESAAETAAKLGIDVSAAGTAQEAVAGADIIVTTTPSTDPILMADWLEPGQHVTAMGSDSDHKNELEPACLVRADLYVCDRQSQCLALGELRPAVAAGLVDAETVFPEIGQIIAGQHPGRTSEEQITICDQTGTGIQDTAIATLARQRCEAAGAGAEFES